MNKSKTEELISIDFLTTILEKSIMLDNDSYCQGWNDLAKALINGVKKIKESRSNSYNTKKGIKTPIN